MSDPTQVQAEYTPAPSIQVVLGMTAQVASTPYAVTLATAMLSPPSANMGGGNGATIWLLDRANPQFFNKPGSFFECQDRVTVPNGIAPLMNADHVLVAAFVGDSTQIPQGDLFAFLMANGAGDALATMERVTSNDGSGINGLTAYALVSVPALGPAIEFLEFPVPAVDLRAVLSSVPKLWLGAYFPFELNLGSDGKYLPERSLDPSST
jgi:hypothetical protein